LQVFLGEPTQAKVPIAQTGTTIAFDVEKPSELRRVDEDEW